MADPRPSREERQTTAEIRRRSPVVSVGPDLVPLGSAELSHRVGKVVGYPPLSEMGEQQRREFHEALLEADTFEDLPGKWQAAILKAEQSQPKLRVIGSD